MTNDRTKQWDATTSVATPDWQTTGRTQKALNPPECSEVKSLRVREGSTLDGPTAGCGKPHVRWCGRVPGRNPRHPTRSGCGHAKQVLGGTSAGATGRPKSFCSRS